MAAGADTVLRWAWLVEWTIIDGTRERQQERRVAFVDCLALSDSEPSAVQRPGAA